MAESAEKKDSLFVVSSSPHTHSGASVRGIMLDVIIAMLPITGAAIYLFGWDAIRLLLVCVISCVATEALCRKAMGRNAGIDDLSAVVTGMLLAFNLPPALPAWMAVTGSVIAIALAKQVFGGIGYNPFNPALIARVVLLISFPVAMTNWSPWIMAAPAAGIDAMTAATPLGAFKSAVSLGQTVPYLQNGITFMQFFIGHQNGCIGEVSSLAILLGGLYLLFRRCINWQTPVFYLGTVTIMSAIIWIAAPEKNLPPHLHLVTGGLMLGAFFMATDMVTSPVTRKGMAVFGAGCGILTVLIRTWGGYPEGVSFAILLMNAVTPLINRATRPRIFGTGSKKK